MRRKIAKKVTNEQLDAIYNPVKKKVYLNRSYRIYDDHNFSKDINISGFVVISSSKVTFKEIIIDKQVIAEKKIKYYEEEFKNKIINESLTNIFDKKRIKNYLQNFLK